MSNVVQRLISGLLATMFFIVGAASARADNITVLAAASLTDALQAVGDAYQAKTGESVKFSFASSSALAKQIEAGAPADIFASATDEWMKYLADRNLIDTASRVSPIGNYLVMIAPTTSAQGPVTISAKLDLAKLLGKDGRLAVGDPAHVPAGTYAKQALIFYGLWAIAEPRLAIADDVRGALAFVERGETPLGIVYTTDAVISKGVKTIATFPAESHQAITYPFALVKGAHADAGAFLAFVKGKDGVAIFTRYGFTRI
jgi:molybdate transport system substrate-binding protein